MKHNLKTGNYTWRQYPTGEFYPCTVHAVSDDMAIISEDNGKQFAVYISEHVFMSQDGDNNHTNKCSGKHVYYGLKDIPFSTIADWLDENFDIYSKVK